jgi:hypothetical protein
MTGGSGGGVAARPRWTAASLRCAGAGILFAAALSGCVERGDFGRPRSSIWNDTILPFAGNVAAASREEAVSYFIYTDSENELRDRAWRFLMPAHERAIFQEQVSELSRTRVLPRMARLQGDASYFNVLRWSRGSSPSPMFRRIGEDAAADRQLIPEFVALAERVLASDEARLKLLVHVRDLDEAQVQNAVARVAENRCLVAWVYAEAQGRAKRYRHALERLAIEAPQGEAAYAEREVIALEAEIPLFAILGIRSLRDERCEPGAFTETASGDPPDASPVVRK